MFSHNSEAGGCDPSVHTFGLPEASLPVLHIAVLCDLILFLSVSRAGKTLFPSMVTLRQWGLDLPHVNVLGTHVNQDTRENHELPTVSV